MGIQALSSKINALEQLDIVLQDDDPSGYTMVSIDGLGSPDAQINTQGSSYFDGEEYNSARVIKRTINVTLAINGSGDTEETNRTAIYKWFPIRRSILFGVLTSTKDLVIDAYVERLVMNVSSKIENAIITLVSPGPFFRDRVASTVIFGSASENINYYGDIYNGFVATLTFSGTATTVTLTHVGLSKTITINTTTVSSIVGSAIQSGDVIILDTRNGNKKLTLTRGSTDYNILPAIGTFPDWPYLENGVNTIQYGAASGLANISVSLEYDNLYSGV